jgi:hypothetical protein
VVNFFEGGAMAGSAVVADALAKDLTRRLVAVLEPRELQLFDETWEALGGRPRRARRHEDALGLGLPEAGELLVTAVASGVVTTVLQDLGERTGSRLARLRRKPAKTTLPVALPPERLADIRKKAYARARKLGMSARQADELADALISELATAPART